MPDLRGVLSVVYFYVVFLLNYLIMLLDIKRTYFSAPYFSVKQPAVAVFARIEETCRFHFIADFHLDPSQVDSIIDYLISQEGVFL